MRRNDILLTALARQGDKIACIEVARRYLRGDGDFPKSVRSALEYLAHPAVLASPEALAVVCDNLELEELLEHDLAPTLKRAAERGCASAQFKLGVWVLTRRDGRDLAAHWFSSAAAAGDMYAAMALTALREPGSCLLSVLRPLTTSGAIDGGAIAILGARDALGDRDLDRLSLCVSCASKLPNAPVDDVNELTVAGLQLVSRENSSLVHLCTDSIQSALEARAEAGDTNATYLLGCALAGIDACPDSKALVRNTNLRAGVAMLLRAADGGEPKAWLKLYRLVADCDSPVANSQMSLFFLEKAAKVGDPAAQRILGGLLLSKAVSLKDSERAMHWLFKSAQASDHLAAELLQTLVLPVEGSVETAQAIADTIHAFCPMLASRLMVARHFGLTKLEALTVNPETGIREWGLVVERNPFIVQGRLSAARAIPALTPAAWNAVAAFRQLSRSRGDAAMADGNLRQRVNRLRIACARFGVDPATFFASASSGLLDQYRLGPKWAYRVRETLQHAICPARSPSAKRPAIPPSHERHPARALRIEASTSMPAAPARDTASEDDPVHSKPSKASARPLIERHSTPFDDSSFALPQ